MSYEEKGTWVYLTVAVGVYAAYLAIVLGRLDGGSVTAVSYGSALVWSVGASIAAGIVGRIALEIVKPSESHQGDRRDKEIYRFGEYVGRWPLVAGALAALVLALAEVPYFWIANAVYLGFVSSTILASTVKLVAYRRGL
jgi:hypothetical protein